MRLPPTDGAPPLKLRTCAVTPDSSIAIGAGIGGWLAVWSMPSGELVKMVLLPDAVAAVSQLTPLPPVAQSSASSAPFFIACDDGNHRLIELTSKHFKRPSAVRLVV